MSLPILIIGRGPSRLATLPFEHETCAVNWRDDEGVPRPDYVIGDDHYWREFKPACKSIDPPVPPIIPATYGWQVLGYTGPRALAHYAMAGRRVILAGFDLSTPHHLVQLPEWVAVLTWLKTWADSRNGMSYPSRVAEMDGALAPYIPVLGGK